MARSFLDTIAREADKSLKHSLKEAERNRKREARENLRLQKQAVKEQEKKQRQTLKEQERQQKDIAKTNKLVLEIKDLKKSGETRKAIAKCKRLLATNTHKHSAFKYIIEIYEDIKDYENVENATVEALRFFPKSEEFKDKLIEVARILTA